jgi:hypothetical protein
MVKSLCINSPWILHVQYRCCIVGCKWGLEQANSLFPEGMSSTKTGPGKANELAMKRSNEKAVLTVLLGSADF